MKLRRSGRALKKGALHLTLSAVLAVQPVLVHAQAVTPDSAAAAQNRPALDTALNGVPVVNIAPANSAGLSHNLYTDFNVGTQGLILNNSASVGVSDLGGGLMGNPRFAGQASREATKILNEVTSTNPTLLQGYLEVHGRDAAVIVANPNGITCDGCGFLNTPRATLTTGTPQIDAAGDLSALDVDDGNVVIQGLGLDATDVDHFDIISRATEINAALHAQNLTIVAGRNEVDYATGTATAKPDDGSPKPTVAIDSRALGGMYANRITLIGTEQGVGVNLEGPVATRASDLVITSAGGLALKGAVGSQRDVRVAATDAVTVEGTITAARDVLLNTQETLTLTETAQITAQQDVTLTADGDLQVDGLIFAGRDGTLTSTTGTVTLTEDVTTAGDLAITADRIVQDSTSEVSADGIIRVTATGQDVNLAGLIRSLTTVEADAETTLITSGSVYASDRLTLTGESITLLGTTESGGALTIAADGTVTMDAAATTKATGDLSLTAQTADLAGTLEGAQLVTVTIQQDLTHAGAIRSDGVAEITALGVLQNNGTIQLLTQGTVTGGTSLSQSAAASLSAAQGLTLASGGDFVNDGVLSVTGDLTFDGGTVTNNGVLRADQDVVGRNLSSFENRDLVFAGRDIDLELTADGTLTNYGTLLATEDMRLNGAGGSRMGTLENRSGTIETMTGNLTIAATDVTNRRDEFDVDVRRVFWRSFTQKVNSGATCTASPEACARISGTVLLTEHPYLEGTQGYG